MSNAMVRASSPMTASIYRQPSSAQVLHGVRLKAPWRRPIPAATQRLCGLDAAGGMVRAAPPCMLQAAAPPTVPQ